MKLGQRIKSKSYGWFSVVGMAEYPLCEIEFELTGYRLTCYRSHASRGSVKDPFYPSVHGVGYIGVGRYDSRPKGEHVKAYTAWNGMLARCYSKKKLSIRPTYSGCSVCKEWHNYQNFAEWYYLNIPDLISCYDLDKDVKIKGNKIYSPETCVFLTRSENAREANSRNHKAGVTNEKCIYIHRGMYEVVIKRKYIGRYKTIEEAVIARDSNIGKV